MDGKFLSGGIKDKGLLLNQLSRILAENREPSFVDFANFCDVNMAPLRLPRWSSRESACQCSRCKRYGFDPWDRKISWTRKKAER